MEPFVLILIAVITIVGKVMDAKNKNDDKKKPLRQGQQKPVTTAEEMIRRMQREQEIIRRQQQEEAERQLAEQHKHFEEEEIEKETMEEEEYEEEDNTPHYEPIPAAQSVPPTTYAPKPAETILPDNILSKNNMRPVPLAQNLPDEGESAFDNRIQNNDITSSKANDTDEPQFTIEDMRKAVIYQTILERPKF